MNAIADPGHGIEPLQLRRFQIKLMLGDQPVQKLVLGAAPMVMKLRRVQVEQGRNRWRRIALQGQRFRQPLLHERRVAVRFSPISHRIKLPSIHAPVNYMHIAFMCD